jgi:AcrR family transcriptional regulator
MPRPSRALDKALLAAGRELLPQRGCAGLSVREVAQRAGVNLGMFHYHFRTRDAFLRAVLLEVALDATPVGSLQGALGVLGRFLRDHRPLIGRVLADALAGEPCARAFVRDNLPRHVAVLKRIFAAARAAGEVRPIAFEQALGICAGAVMMPILVGGAIAQSGMAPASRTLSIRRTLLSDAAIDERIVLALAGLAPQARERASARKRRAA